MGANPLQIGPRTPLGVEKDQLFEPRPVVATRVPHSPRPLLSLLAKTSAGPHPGPPATSNSEVCSHARPS
eukprot:4832771-Pyramimonas_sp.AAC.1